MIWKGNIKEAFGSLRCGWEVMKMSHNEWMYGFSSSGGLP
jgi:hypothetical protein